MGALEDRIEAARKRKQSTGVWGGNQGTSGASGSFQTRGTSRGYEAPATAQSLGERVGGLARGGYNQYRRGIEGAGALAAAPVEAAIDFGRGVRSGAGFSSPQRQPGTLNDRATAAASEAPAGQQQPIRRIQPQLQQTQPLQQNTIEGRIADQSYFSDVNSRRRQFNTADGGQATYYDSPTEAATGVRDGQGQPGSNLDPFGKLAYDLMRNRGQNRQTAATGAANTRRAETQQSIQLEEAKGRQTRETDKAKAGIAGKGLSKEFVSAITDVEGNTDAGRIAKFTKFRESTGQQGDEWSDFANFNQFEQFELLDPEQQFQFIDDNKDLGRQYYRLMDPARKQALKQLSGQ